MNRHAATKVEELTGGELAHGSLTGVNLPPVHIDSLQTGRIRQSGDGVRMFVW
jgi:hypothetical protein